jgi:peptidoglycan/LPS O-acetylase OafA/YrhL
MVVSPAWTLAPELYFYALAPFIVRRPLGVVIALALASLAARIAAYSAGFSDDPWTYRFFPFELALFLAGAISYHIHQSIREAELPGWAFVVAWSAIGAVLAYPNFESGSPTFFTPARVGLLCYLTVALPFLFKHTEGAKFDRLSGDLSYPVYLCHMIFIELLQGVPRLAPYPHLRTIIAVASSLVLSSLVALRIETPIDRYRQWRVKAQAVAVE